MANSLRGTLEALHAALHAKDGNEASLLVQDLESVFLGNLTESQIGLCSSLLFNGSNSLLEFTRKVTCHSEFSKCQNGCLTILQSVLPTLAQSLHQYIKDIIGACSGIFKSAKVSSNKEKSLGIFITLVGMRESSRLNVDVGCLRKLCIEEIAKTKSGTSSSVKGCCFHLLGTISQYYPEDMIDHSDRLFDVYLRELKREFERTSDQKLIEGSLKGLCCLMVHFPKTAESDPEMCREIFKYTLISIQPKTDLTRYAVPTAGLQIIQKHSSQFGRLLVEQHKLVHGALQKWFYHQNPHMRHEAHVAISSFLKQIVVCLKDKASEGEAKILFTYFVSKFQEILEAHVTTSKELSLVIQGYGLFAELCSKYMSYGYLQKMLSVMMDRSVRIYLGPGKKQSDSGVNQLHQLPSFLFSLGNIIKEVISESEKADEKSERTELALVMTESFQRSLCQLCVHMIKEYHHLNKKFSSSCCSSLVSIMTAFSARPDYQKVFVSEIVYQGLIRCCSKELSEYQQGNSGFAILDESDLPFVAIDSRTIARQDYVDLWKGLVCPAEKYDFIFGGSRLVGSQQKATRKVVFNELLTSLISIISKLDLSSKNMSAMEGSDTSGDDLVEQIENASDFQLFTKLCDLFKKVLPAVTIRNSAGDITKDIFEICTCDIIKELIKASTSFPTVAGFYDLLSTMMRICISYQYFSKTDSVKASDDSMEWSEIGDFSINTKERTHCLLLIKKFVTEIVSHVTRWQGDVLNSSLFFVLSLPSEVATEILDNLVQPLQLAFRLSLGYNVLAEAGIDALERWKGTRDSIFPQALVGVLPDIEPFLHVRSKKDLQHIGGIMSKRKKKHLNQDDFKIEDSALQKVHNRVVRFLGSIGGLAYRCLDRDSESDDATVATNNQVSVCYSVPFQELKLDLQLESFISRVAELAEKSATRQTKVTACELLHSLTVYIIGKSAHQDEAIQQQYPLTGIYECIFPVALKLACDVELVTRQLFEPLVMQMVHWFTNNKKYESPDTALLLESIMNGLVDETNGSLRDFCARCVVEFLLWTMKQDVGSENMSRKNAKSLFKRLYSLAQHPSMSKRLGSAMAFNQMYKVFREQEAFVDEFTFELLVTYIDSLCMAQDDEDAMGTKSACLEALRHLQRIITTKKDLLNKESKIRRVPPGFPRDKPVILHHIVDWLFFQCGRPQTECRHTCMELFYAFIPALVENQNPAQWMKSFVETNGHGKLIACFEGGLSSRSGIAIYPQISPILKESKLKSALHWFDLFLASLDCYAWVMQQRLLSPSMLFEGDGSNLFHSIDYFLHNISRCEMDEVLGGSDVFTPKEREIFAKKRCTVVVRIFQFTVLMLRQYQRQCLEIYPSSVWEPESLLGVAMLCLVDPNALGFNVDSDISISELLPPLIADVIDAMYTTFTGELKQKFVSLLRNELLKMGSLLEQLQFISDLNVEKISQLVAAYQILAKKSILSNVLSDITEADVLKEFAMHSFSSLTRKTDSNLCVLVQPTQRSVKLCNGLLELVIDLGLSKEFLGKMIMDSSVLCNDSEEQIGTKHGEFFFSTYKAILCKELCCKSSVYIPILMKQGSDLAAAKIFNELLEFLFRDRQVRIKCRDTLCWSIMKEWKSSHSSDETKITIFIKVVSLDSKICTDTQHPGYELAFEYFRELLTSTSLSLNLKSQALTLVGLFCAGENQQRQNGLKSCLYSLCSLHFPSRSTEFTPGTSKFDDYAATLKTLLFGLEMTGSTALLEILISVFCKEENHVLEDDFEMVLEKCLLNVPDAKQRSVLDVPYKMFSDVNSPHSVSVRCRIMNCVLRPLLSRSTKNASREFFSMNIGQIMHCLLEDHKRHSIEIWKDQLALKTCNYKLSESMFNLLQADEFKVESSPLVQSFSSSAVGAGSTKFLKAFMGRVVRDKNEDLTREHELLEERRLFHCAVYNAVIAAVTCTQTEVKWFDAFLFCDNSKKKEFLFDNIISKDKFYSFPAVTDEPLQRKKIFAVRRDYRDNARARNSAYESVNYLLSLAGSSLSEDVDRFDNNSFLVVQQDSQQIKLSNAESSADVEVMRHVLTELESDEMNDHQCMPKIISLLSHMKRNGIGFPDSDEIEADSKPDLPALQKWMNALIQKLNSLAHINVKIFIVKLIINCETMFQPFAEHFLVPVMKVILSYFKRNSEAGDSCLGMDQFIVDAVVMLLSWSPIAIPKSDTEDKILVRAVLEALMRRIKDSVSEVFRRNLDLVKTAFECWNERIEDLNTDIVLRYCSSTDYKSLDNFHGLQLLAAMLSNGLPPYTASLEVDRESYFQRIFSNLLSSRKPVVDITSEIIGMSLNHLSTVQNEREGEIHNIASNLFSKMVSSTKFGVSSIGIFMTSLHKVARHYPPIAEIFLKQVLFNLPKLPGPEIKSCCIDVLRLCVDKTENLLAELKAKDFISMLIHRDDNLQHSCLRLCISLMQKTVTWREREPTDSGEIKIHQECVDFFLPHIGEVFKSHPSSRCRQELYDLAMQIYDVQKGFPPEYQSEETLRKVKLILLHGLDDQEQMLKTMAANFWSEDRGRLQPRLAVNLSEKLINMLDELYQPEVDEAGFLSSCCNMLMQAASRSPDFERPVFEHPLSDCAFQELNFAETWRRPGSGSLIEETMRSTIISPSYSNISSASSLSKEKRKIGPNVLQATQCNLQFSSTLGDHGEGRSTYNWMTGESLDTFSSLSTDVESWDFQQQRAGGLAYRRHNKIRKTKRVVGQGFGKQMSSGVLEAKDDRALDLKRLRYRIQKDSATSNFKFARVTAKKQEAKKRSIQWEKMKHEHAIQVYRKYRIGELPDIQIPHRGLITSLTALAQHDSAFLQQLMSATVHAIVKEQMESGSNKYIENLSSCIMHILTSSREYDSTFMGCMLKVILRNPTSFNIPPVIISQAALKSDQKGLGIRVIEEWLILQPTQQEPTSKRRKLVSPTVVASEAEILAWVSLARLYRKDFDTLRGVFAATPIARSLFSEVISFETHGEYSHASKIYQKALLEEQDPEPNDLERDLWEDSLLNCLEKLGKWQEVNRFCDRQINNSFKTGWTESHFQDRFLSTSLHAKMLLLLQGDGSLFDEITSFVEGMTKQDENKDAKIESKYSDIVAMFYIYQGDYNSARYYLHKSLEAFSTAWEGKSQNNQTDSLNKLFHLSDMMDFLDIAQKHSDGSECTISGVINVLESWTNCVPHGIHDPISAWQDMVTYRCFFVDELMKKIKPSGSSESQDAEILSFQKDVVKRKISMILNAADQACEQKNFQMARQFLNQQAEDVLQALGSQSLASEESMRVSLSTASYYLNFAHHLITSKKSGDDITKASKAIAESHVLLLDLVEKKQLESNERHWSRLYTLLGQAYDLALDLLGMQLDNKTAVKNLERLLSSMEGHSETDELSFLLRKQGLVYFSDGVDRVYSDVENVTELYIKYAKFCDRVMQSNDYAGVRDSASLADSEGLACNVIKYAFRTMKHQNSKSGKEASLKYPRLLQLVENYPGCVKALFLQEAAEVPTWVFLRWVGQMVALLDKPEADSVHEIVSRLAATYPQAVIYPVKTSFPDFSFSRDEFGKRNKNFVNKLHSDLDAHLPVVKTFIKNLTHLTSPAHAFKEWYENAYHVLQSKVKSGKQAIIKNYQNMYNDIFADSQSKLALGNDDDLYGTPPSYAMVGTFRIKFAEKFRADVDKAFGGSTGGMALTDAKKFFSMARKIYLEMNTFCQKQRPQTLKEYSKWLFDFHSLHLDKEELEIPGQYKGESKPMLQYHTKIIGFDDTIRVMSSLQQPKKITIKASDCKNYQYLVKGNEDLRQDQRIQQLFEVMNVALRQDPMCSKRKLHIKTYQVVPVTSRLGLIEWIDNTRTLQEIVYAEARRTDKSACLDKAQATYLDWLNKYSPRDPKQIVAKYGSMMKNANYTEVCSIYQDVTSHVPRDLLRNSYLRLSSSPEAFLTLRREFATSYGALCAAHWILGIGDRHTSNCMISVRSGTAIGIDFGHAFGTATEVLGVPELVPFRLSPQLCYLLAPHPAKAGLLRQSMLFCFSALRSKRKIILTMLDVFLKEPSVDWLNHANKIVRVHGPSISYLDSDRKLSSANSSDSSRGTVGNPQWYPLRKIEIVNRKLSGCHPSDITQDELQHNCQISISLTPSYKAVVAGVKGKCRRSGFEGRSLSVDDQVDCLIDQACDPNILARSYQGWRYWI